MPMPRKTVGGGNYLLKCILWAHDHDLPIVEVAIIDQPRREPLDRILNQICEKSPESIVVPKLGGQ